MDEGTILDRLNRFEKGGVIASVHSWREIRELKNEIAHEYLIEKSDHVVRDALQRAPELLGALDAFKEYLKSKNIDFQSV